MNETDASWFTPVYEWAAEAAFVVLQAIPAVLSAIAVLLVGWLVARLIRTLVRRVCHAANRVVERVFRTGSLASARLSAPMIELVADIAYWIVIFVVLTISMRVAGFALISGWLNQIVLHLPNLVVGFLIIGAGYIASLYVGRLIKSGATSKSGERLLLARLAQALIFIATLMIGLDQFGVKVTFLAMLLAVITGAVVIGFSLAFGFGSRGHVANLIAARTAQGALRPGVTVRIGEVEGSVLEVSPSHIILDTEHGRTLIPARLMDDSIVHIVTAGGDSANG